MFIFQSLPKKKQEEKNTHRVREMKKYSMSKTTVGFVVVFVVCLYNSISRPRTLQMQCMNREYVVYAMKGKRFVGRGTTVIPIKFYSVLWLFSLYCSIFDYDEKKKYRPCFVCWSHPFLVLSLSVSFSPTSLL